MENNKHICKYCGKEFETSVKLGGHVSHCKENPKYKNTLNKIQQTRQNNLNENNPFENHTCQCKYCGNNYQINHIRHNDFLKGKYNKTCSIECAHKLTNQNTDLKEKNKKISNSLKGKSTWIKGMKRNIMENNINNKWTKDPNWRPYKICPICGKKYETRLRYCSEECKKIGRFNKLSKLAKKSNFGGYQPNSIKKHHHGNYKGIHYDSSWELAYLVWCLEHNIPIKRCEEVRYYKINEQIKKYYPDFVINNNEIIEIKGLYNDVVKAKSEQNPDIKLLFYNDLKDIIQYVINKYGNKYWEILNNVV